MSNIKEVSHHLLLRVVQVLLQAGDSPRLRVMMITIVNVMMVIIGTMVLMITIIIVTMVMMAVLSSSSWMTMIMKMLLMRRPLRHLVRAFISSSAAERDFCLSSSWRLTWIVGDITTFESLSTIAITRWRAKKISKPFQISRLSGPVQSQVGAP